jgi:predicted secreted hydrolase
MLKRLLVPASIALLFACKPPESPSAQSALQMTSGTAVKKGVGLQFPADHGAHPEQGIEWWYVTAHLESATGERFGVQWTLFRTLMPGKLESIWWDNNLYFAHFALQQEQQHVAFERFARAGQAAITSFPFSAVIDHWQLHSVDGAFLPLNLKAAEQNYGVELRLSDSPMTLHGDHGYSQKTQSGHASYYYSYPFLKAEGSLRFAGKDYKVKGNAWYDREWSASLLDNHQLGWDWFSVVDSDSRAGLMVFCIRGKQQGYEYCSGTRIASDGEATAIAGDSIRLSVLETVTLDNKDYPSKWQLELADSPVTVIESITKDSRNQLTFPYWEGRIQTTGGFNGKGYAELTGY